MVKLPVGAGDEMPPLSSAGEVPKSPEKGKQKVRAGKWFKDGLR
jgi:hypothetical protein